MGGAMDTVAGAQNIIVVMTHASKTANPNCCRSAPCRSPAWAVFAGYSPTALLEIVDGAFVLREVAPGSAPTR